MKIQGANQNPLAQAFATTSLRTQSGGLLLQNQSVSGTGSLSNQGGAGEASLNLSPLERLERYAQHIESRLDNLALAESGVDLSAVRDAFHHNIDRLKTAISDGGLSGEDLERGIQNTVNLVRTGVQQALGQPTILASHTRATGAPMEPEAPAQSTTLDVQHSLDRLQAMQDHIRERLNQYMANTPESGQSLVQEASDRLNNHFDRMRNALQTGSMSLGDIQRSLEHTMQLLAEDLQQPVTSLGATFDPGGGGTTTVSVAQARILDQAATGGAAVEHEPTTASAPAAESLSLRWQHRPQITQFLNALHDDSRQARGLGLATYGPKAQILALQPNVFGNGLDVAI